MAGRGDAGSLGHGENLSRERAEQRAVMMKRGLFAMSVVTFVLLLQAATHHVTGVTSHQQTTPNNNSNVGQSPSFPQPSGFGFGNSITGPPVTSTGVS